MLSINVSSLLLLNSAHEITNFTVHLFILSISNRRLHVASFRRFFMHNILIQMICMICRTIVNIIWLRHISFRLIYSASVVKKPWLSCMTCSWKRKPMLENMGHFPPMIWTKFYFSVYSFIKSAWRTIYPF